MQTGTITLRRERTLTALLVGFRVMIDGVKVGSIRSGKEKSFSVQPGQHTVTLGYLWCKSEVRQVDVAPGGTTPLVCSATKNLIIGYFAPLLFPKRLFEWQ